MTETDFSWLEPNQQHTIFQEYDVEAGYIEWARRTRMSFKRNLTKEYSWSGIRKERMLDATTAELYRNLIEHDDPLLEDISYKRKIVDTIITPHVDNLISGYFMSEYVPIWMRFYKNDPKDTKRAPSTFWHCDSGPSKHLKILLYLSDTDEIDGNTAFADVFTTQRFKNIGYIFCGIDNRKNDLSEMSKKFNIEWTPIVRHLLPGDGIIFEPTNIMHRALLPTKAKRYMIQICLIPSFRYWKDSIEKTTMPNENNAFPRLQF